MKSTCRAIAPMSPPKMAAHESGVEWRWRQSVPPGETEVYDVGSIINEWMRGCLRRVCLRPEVFLGRVFLLAWYRTSHFAFPFRCGAGGVVRQLLSGTGCGGGGGHLSRNDTFTRGR